MNFKLVGVIFLLMIIYSSSFGQNGNMPKKESALKLKADIITESNERTYNLNLPNSAASKSKSPALALLLSFVLPGAGHYYIDRMDVGKYFLGADIASWIGLISLNVYGDNVREDSRTYSKDHAQINNIDDKNDDYFTNIGSYNNIYEYNNAKLSNFEYEKIYDVNKYYWNWDFQDNRNIYESQRKSSERIYNTRIVFGSLLIANRIVSGISAYLIASKKDGKKSSFYIEPQLLYKDNYSLDGVKINLSKNF